MEVSYHRNAAAIIIAAAEASGLLRDVANALRQASDDYDNIADAKNAGIRFADATCLACGCGGVLDDIENFAENCRSPGYDFYGEGFCVSEYSDDALKLFLELPYQLPPGEAKALAAKKQWHEKELKAGVEEGMRAFKLAEELKANPPKPNADTPWSGAGEAQ